MDTLRCQENNVKCVVTRCCLLTSDRVLDTHMHNFLAFHMRLGEVCLFHQKRESVRQDQVWMSSCSISSFIASSSRISGRPPRDSSQKERSLYLKFWNQCLAVHFSQRLELFADMIRQRTCPPKSQTSTQRAASTTPRFITAARAIIECVRNASSLGNSKVSTPSLSRHVTHSLHVSDQFLSHGIKTARTFWLPYVKKQEHFN